MADQKKGNGKNGAQKKQPAKKGLDDEKVRGLGKALSKHQAKLPNGAKATVKALSDGKVPSNKALVSLRDGINETSAKMRQAEQPEVAKELSNLNRLVRRLERATR